MRRGRVRVGDGRWEGRGKVRGGEKKGRKGKEGREGRRGESRGGEGRGGEERG